MLVLEGIKTVSSVSEKCYFAQPPRNCLKSTEDFLIIIGRNGGTHCYLHTTVLITECQIQLFHWTFPSHGNTAMLCWLWKKTDIMFIAVFW